MNLLDTVLYNCRTTNPKERAVYKNIPMSYYRGIRDQLNRGKKNGDLYKVTKIRYRFRGPRVHNDHHTLKAEAATFSVYFDRQAPIYASAAVLRHHGKVWASSEISVQTILKARLAAAEYALVTAHLTQQEGLMTENYTSLQEVMEVRDTLLQHVYRLLARPNGILLKDMPGAIEDRLNIVNGLEQHIERLHKSNEAYAHENTRLRQGERHDHTLIGGLYEELAELYKRERGE